MNKLERYLEKCWCAFGKLPYLYQSVGYSSFVGIYSLRGLRRRWEDFEN